MKSFLFICMMVTGSIALPAQKITGDWQGLLPAGGRQIRIVFHVKQTGDVYSATFDSPDQNAYNIPATNTFVQNDSISIVIAQLPGGYKGRWNGADEIKGVFSQASKSVEMNMKRADPLAPKPDALKTKSQTPQPPFDYVVEEVGYENTLQKVHLAGTFTKPRGGTKFPVVLMITGSSAQDRDEGLGNHKPFWVIADYLTKQGIAVLRVDDRSMGKSTGNFSRATSADFATDVMAGIGYLKTRKDIDASKIGLIGHSEGAVIAPYVAARSKDIAFIVMLAGPVVGGKETMHFQAVTKPLAALPAQVSNAYGDFYDKMLQVVVVDSLQKDVEGYTRRTYLNWKKQQPPLVAAMLFKGTDEEVVRVLAGEYKELTGPWWRFFFSYDVKQDLKKIQVPVLALNGEKDEQVDPANLTVIKNILTENRNPHFKVHEVPGVNHLFQHCKACGSVAEYMALDETFDKATLAMIGDWILANIK